MLSPGMRETLFVISDLHLGGDDKFAICASPGQALLADFLTWVAAQQTPSHDVHLIVNGDSVDFLAEPEFLAFTAHDKSATRKLQTIFDRTEAVWKAMAAVVASGAQLTFTLGNHDLELSLPGPRRLLQRILGRGRFEFLYDNQALTIGDVLIEHGNRYDRWNAVNHDSLRRARVQASLGRAISDVEAPAGSRLVVDVMNELKDRYSFVNLLKPENEAAIPLLAVLDPSALQKIPDLVALSAQPSAEGLEAAPTMHPQDRKALTMASQLALGDTEAVGFTAIRDFITGWREQAAAWYRAQQIDKLYKAFRYFLGAQLGAFDTSLEAKEYHEAALDSARDGFRVVLYGHTHLPKRIPLLGDSLYLNTGTWADIMCLPAAVLLNDSEERAKEDLAVFVDDLEHNRMQQWVSRVPTFARVELEDGRSLSSDLFVYEGNGAYTRLPDGRVSRLLRGGDLAAGA